MFEEWLFIQREQLHVLVSEAYSDLAAYTEAKGALSDARRYVQRQIELDPLREPTYRQQMRILAQQGERSAALAVFERCRRLLNEELGLDPEPETLALHMQILNAEASSATATPRSATVEAALFIQMQTVASPTSYNLP